MKKYLYIVNPIAGKGRGKKVIPHIKSYCYSKSIPALIVETKGPQHATNLIKDESKNINTVIAVGGDGTINEIINGIENYSNINLAVLPIGSGNDFVKNITIPKKIEDMLAVYHDPLKQNIIKADIGNIKFSEDDNHIIKSHKFINSLGIGFDAYVGYLKKSNTNLTGISSYIYSVIKALFNFKMIETEIEYDKIKVSGSKLMISIGNGFSSGGGFYLNPNAVIDDGILNLSIFNTVTRRRLLQALPMALINKTDRIPEAKMTSTKRITIKLKTPYFAHCDGEIISNKIINAEISIFTNAINIISKKNI